MTEIIKQQVVDRLLDNKVKIYDLELTQDSSYEDNIDGRYEYNKKWQGKISYRGHEYMFLLKCFKTECNESTTAVIASNQKPKDMNDDEWDNTVDYLQEYIEKDFRKDEDGKWADA